ncbi:MAG: hypothetical protein ACRD2O_06620, partial [Terriglobia bacterium]
GSHDERLASSWAFHALSDCDTVRAMSHVRRLKLGDRVFFVTVNLHRTLSPFAAAEFLLILQSIEESRRPAGIRPVWLRSDARPLAWFALAYRNAHDLAGHAGD